VTNLEYRDDVPEGEKAEIEGTLGGVADDNFGMVIFTGKANPDNREISGLLENNNYKGSPVPEQIQQKDLSLLWSDNNPEASNIKFEFCKGDKGYIQTNNEHHAHYGAPQNGRISRLVITEAGDCGDGSGGESGGEDGSEDGSEEGWDSITARANLDCAPCDSAEDRVELRFSEDYNIRIFPTASGSMGRVDWKWGEKEGGEPDAWNPDGTDQTVTVNIFRGDERVQILSSGLNRELNYESIPTDEVDFTDPEIEKLKGLSDTSVHFSVTGESSDESGDETESEEGETGTDEEDEIVNTLWIRGYHRASDEYDDGKLQFNEEPDWFEDTYISEGVLVLDHSTLDAECYYEITEESGNLVGEDIGLEKTQCTGEESDNEEAFQKMINALEDNRVGNLYSEDYSSISWPEDWQDASNR
jgi:hypothetical protein